MLDVKFWTYVSNLWINVLSEEDIDKTEAFSNKITEEEKQSDYESIPSIFDEIFGEDF